MSLKLNILVNYASQLYVTVAGIVIIPRYIQYMGSETYGLIGFFSMLQAWFNLLDIGLSPTIARESARYHGGALSALEYRRLFRALNIVFVMIAVVAGSLLWLAAEFVAEKWLHIEELKPQDVTHAVQIMAISVALRWMAGFYRGVIAGAERLVWLGAFNSAIASIRFFGVFASMWTWGFTPLVFFMHQLLVVLVEINLLWWQCSRLLPHKTSLDQPIGWSWNPIKSRLKFSLAIAFTSSVWVIVTQTDKLILSGVLPLTDYAYFTLAVTVAGGVTIIAGPISGAIMPRMARQYAEGDQDGLVTLYRKSTRWVTAIAGVVALTMLLTAKPILYAWSGNWELADHAAPIMKLYGLGNLILAVSAFPYYLQYAMGNMRYHLIGNGVMVVALVPAIIYAAERYGAIGAGYIWFTMNLMYLIFWTGFVHSKLLPKLHFRWLFLDVGRTILPLIVIAIVITAFNANIESRVEGVVFSGCTMLSLIIALAFDNADVKTFFRKKMSPLV